MCRRRRRADDHDSFAATAPSSLLQQPVDRYVHDACHLDVRRPTATTTQATSRRFAPRPPARPSSSLTGTQSSTSTVTSLASNGTTTATSTTIPTTAFTTTTGTVTLTTTTGSTTGATTASRRRDPLSLVARRVGPHHHDRHGTRPRPIDRTTTDDRSPARPPRPRPAPPPLPARQPRRCDGGAHCHSGRGCLRRPGRYCGPCRRGTRPDVPLCGAERSTAATRRRHRRRRHGGAATATSRFSPSHVLEVNVGGNAAPERYGLSVGRWRWRRIGRARRRRPSVSPTASSSQAAGAGAGATVVGVMAGPAGSAAAATARTAQTVKTWAPRISPAAEARRPGSIWPGGPLSIGQGSRHGRTGMPRPWRSWRFQRRRGWRRRHRRRDFEL